MLTVMYNADTGNVAPDNKVWGFVTSAIAEYLDSPEVNSSDRKHVVTVGSITMFNAFRVAIKRGMVGHSDVELKTATQHSYVDSQGQMEDPDVWKEIVVDEDLLTELLT